MKKIIVSLIFITIISLVSARIWSVNKAVELPPIHTFNVGDKVALEKDIMFDEFDEFDYFEGYSITVNDSQIMTYDEYLDKYQYEEKKDAPLFEETDFTFPEMVYELHVTVKNTNTVEDDPNDESSFRFFDHLLVGTNFFMQINSTLLEIAHPAFEDNDMMGFRLRHETEMDFYLPFYFSPTSIYNPLSIEDVRKDDVYLVVSKYPNIKKILIE